MWHTLCFHNWALSLGLCSHLGTTAQATTGLYHKGRVHTWGQQHRPQQVVGHMTGNESWVMAILVSEICVKRFCTSSSRYCCCNLEEFFLRNWEEERRNLLASEKDASSESGNEFSEESYVLLLLLHLLRLVMIVHWIVCNCGRGINGSVNRVG